VHQEKDFTQPRGHGVQAKNHFPMLLRPRRRTGGDWEIQSVAKPAGGAKKKTVSIDRESKNTRRNSDLTTQEGTIKYNKDFSIKAQ
jgi:hypothetical protein